MAVQRDRSERLQHLRGFGALLVLLFHASFYLDQFRGDGRFLTYFSGFLGIYGVAVFFALSGYLMAGASLNGNAARFLMDRIVRIYPFFLIIVLLTSVGLWLTGYPRRPDGVALLLAPSGPRDFMLGVEWTLLFEMTYYVVITIAMAVGFRWLLSWAFGAWLGCLVLMSLFGLGPEQTGTPTMLALFGQTANSAFLLGFLMYDFVPVRAPRYLPQILASCATIIAMTAPFNYDIFHRWIAAVSGVLLIAAALSAAPATRSWGTHFFSKLGDASYALYLVHVPVILLTQHILPIRVPAIIVFIVWVGGSLLIALLLSPLDLALHKILKARVRGARTSSVSSAAGGFIILFLGVSQYQQYKISATSESADRARIAVLNRRAAAKPSVLAAIDSASLRPDGRLIARGFAIDLDAPDNASHIAIEQAGRIIALDRMTRMRPRIADSAGRPDLATVRFGFALVTDGPLECNRGALNAKVVLSSGTVVSVAGGAMEQFCAAGSDTASR